MPSPTVTKRSRKVVLNSPVWERECRKAGLLTDSERAQVIGVGRQHFNEVQNGRVLPGNKFIAGVMATFGAHMVPVLFKDVSA